MASHQISTILASNGQSKQTISQNNHFSLFPRKRTFNLHPLLAPSSSVSTSSISTVASTSSQPISVSVSFGSKSMKHRGDRSGKSNISTQEMEELEWNFPLFEGLERGSGGSSNLISDERTSTTETHLELKEEFDMDLFGQPNLVAAATINNGQSTNFDIKSILDPILFQQPSNDQPSEPAFDFSYTTQNNDVDLFTNHHLSLGVAHPISVITESPIIFNNSYDVSGHVNHVSLPSSTSVEPSSSVSFINPQDLHNTSPIISSPNHDFLAGSPMSLNGDSMPVLPELVSPMISESGDKSEDEDGMPPTPDIMNGVALPSFGFGTPLLGDDLIPDQLRELGLFTGAFGGFIPSVGPSNFSNGVQGGTGVSPLLDPSRPGMKELLKMFPGLTNLDNDILEKILTPPTSNSTPSQPQLNSSIMSPVSSQLREPNEERVPSSSLKSPILEGEMSVRNEIAKRRRNPAIMMKREGTASSVVEISKEEMDIRRRSSCTNQHRRLIDLDAPTQARNYVSPSTTSRKPSHTTVSKRKGAVLPDGTAAIEDEGRVEKKRRQNTLSARRSRARRAEIIGTLEDRKRCLEDELERYKLRVEEAERFIRGFGRV